LLLLFLPVVINGCGDLLGGGGAPSVLSSNPAAGSSQVSVHASVRIRFSTELAPESVADAVRLKQGNRILQVTTYLENGRVVILEPTEALDFGLSFQVVVEPSLQSKSGKLLSDQESWSFTTEGSPLPSLDQSVMRAQLEVLAHDSLRGRGSGTEDELKAAQYLVELFQGYGLVPPQGGSVQPFQAYSEKTQSTVTSQNVLAAVPGSGSLAQEWLVVGAHYDHIGVRAQEDGSPGINNGADDNGSGTVVLLEMARIYREYVDAGAMPVEDRRSVLFIAFGAEELGLLGSCHYAVQEPVVPLALTRAMINFDMVGRVREGVVEVRGYGSSQDWAPLVVNANRPGLILYDPPYFCEHCSDYACFQEGGVPFLWFFSGMHQEYHTPSDDVEFINFQGLADIGEVSLRALIRLAVEEDPLR
jgi:hypothetical protein